MISDIRSVPLMRPARLRSARSATAGAPTRAAKQSALRRGVIALAVALAGALALAACGSSAHRRPTGAASLSPAVRAELSYFPAGDPLLVELQTKPSSPAVRAANQFANSVPTLIAAEAALKDKLASIGINYDTAVRPLLGNPLMFGLAVPAPTRRSASDLLACWVTTSATKLRALIGALHAPQTGSYGAARLYSFGPETLALDGATALLGHAADVRAALARHATAGQGFSPTEFANLTASASNRALVTVAGDLSGVLSRPSAAKARRVPWVAAIRGYSATISASPNALALGFTLRTAASALTSAQLPLATSASTPSLASNFPVSVGLSDPAALLRFLLAAERQIGSRQLATLGAGAMAAAQTLIAQLGRSAILASNGRGTLVRADVSNASAAAAALSKLALAQHGARALGGGFYRVSANTIVGVTDGMLLIGRRASVAQLRAFATAPTVPAAGAHGPLAFRVALGQLLSLAFKHRPSGIAAALAAHLGDITGWARDSTSALTGEATLALH